jgi:hypothetical protein
MLVTDRRQLKLNMKRANAIKRADVFVYLVFKLRDEQARELLRLDAICHCGALRPHVHSALPQ